MRTILAATIAIGVSLSACGGGSSSSDGSEITLPVPANGPVPDLPVSADAATSPLPAIAVRRLNGDGGWVQLKDELPADQPLLVWFWAPH